MYPLSDTLLAIITHHVYTIVLSTVGHVGHQEGVLFGSWTALLLEGGLIVHW